MGIRLEDVVVEYPHSKEAGPASLRALDGLSLQVDRGCSLAIIGPSGCGKSSLLRLVAGLMAPTRGRVEVGGALVTKARSSTALILQDYGLLPWKTVYKNAELGLKLRHVPAKERREKTLAALSQVGLEGFAHSYPQQLSGGMRQRLALARALALDIDLLLMDEPLSALDALLREELQDLLLGLWKKDGYTQVLVTHSIEEAVFLGRRIVVMAPRPGRVVATIENPGMGEESYRMSQDYFQKCREVRSVLDEVIRGE